MYVITVVVIIILFLFLLVAGMLVGDREKNSEAHENGLCGRKTADRIGTILRRNRRRPAVHNVYL